MAKSEKDTPPVFPLNDVAQIALLVPDIDKAVETYWKTVGKTNDKKREALRLQDESSTFVHRKNAD